MKESKEELLNQANRDTIFFFLLIVQSMISFYILGEKKKSILGIPSIDNNTANKLYRYNRRLNFIICIYFFLNALYSYQNVNNEREKEQDKYLILATLFILIGSYFYLPLGNSNLIIEN